jgi:hypothetical protein
VLKEVVETTSQRPAGSTGLDLVLCCIGCRKLDVLYGGFVFKIPPLQNLSDLRSILTGWAIRPGIFWVGPRLYWMRCCHSDTSHRLQPHFST